MFHKFCFIKLNLWFPFAPSFDEGVYGVERLLGGHGAQELGEVCEDRLGGDDVFVSASRVVHLGDGRGKISEVYFGHGVLVAMRKLPIIN